MEEKLSLRPIDREDSKFLHRLFNEHDIAKYWFIEPFYTEDKVKKIAENQSEDTENRRFIFHNGKESLGFIALFGIEQIHGKAEFAIIIDPKQQGKGYAKKATKLAMDYAFLVLNLRKLYLIVDETNEVAVKVYEKMGFVQEAVLKEDYFVNGEYHNAVYMSIFQKDYLAK